MSDAKKNLYQRILAVMDEVGTIEKTGTNTTQNYKFIEQGVVVASLRPLLVKHGIVILPETNSNTLDRYTTEKTDKYGTKQTTTVHANISSKYHLINADDPNDSKTVDWAGEALDYSDKATNKAMTASNKTFLMKLFNISDKEDPDQETIEAPKQKIVYAPVATKPASQERPLPSENQLNRIRELSKELGYDESAVEDRIKGIETTGDAMKVISTLQSKINTKG
jgi:hypothetical protein